MPEINKDLIRRVRVDIDAALAEVAKQHGISLKTDQYTIYPESGFFTLKLEVVLSGGVDKRGALYISLRKLRPNLPALRSTFVHEGKTHVIVGANTTGSKVITKCGAEGFQFKVDAVEQLCAK